MANGVREGGSIALVITAGSRWKRRQVAAQVLLVIGVKSRPALTRFEARPPDCRFANLLRAIGNDPGVVQLLDIRLRQLGNLTQDGLIMLS